MQSDNIIVNLEEKTILDDLMFVFNILQVLVRMKGSCSVECKLEYFESLSNYLVYADSVRLRQILLNFISNAAKFTKKGFIEIKANLLEKQDVDDIDYIEVLICDTGTGIKPEMQSKFFKKERVFDYEINKRMNIHGSGAGLNIVKSLSDMLGYQLYVESKVGEGSIFKILIPVKEIKTSNQFQNDENEIIEVDEDQENDDSLSSKSSNVNVNIREKNTNCKSSNMISLREATSTRRFSISFNKTNKITSFMKSSTLFNSNKQVSSSDLDKTIINNAFNVDFNRLNSSHSYNIIKQQSINSINSFHSSSIRRGSTDSNRLNNMLAPKPILIICDDSELIRNSIKKVFYSIDNLDRLYGIDLCYDGIQVIMKIVEDQNNGNFIKAVFIDENMDYLNGRETVKILKNMIEESKIKKVYFISISANDENEFDSSDYDFCLAKPINKIKLNECLRRLEII